MEQAIKEQWVEALRSGEYEQGNYQLKNHEGKYCCLGVLCEIDPRVDFVDGYARYGDEDTSIAFLPRSYEEAIGLDADHAVGVLVRMNDTDGASFNEIADYIEENL